VYTRQPIPAGASGWPAEGAARIAVAAVSQPGSPFDEIRFVLFSDGMLDAFSAALGSRAGE
jgi:O-acetyl-ADP-ribose deacetylase (regulator of RNase III)